MQLFVGRLPHKFSKQELCRFIARGTRNNGLLGLLQKNKATFGCRMMMMRSKDYGTTEYFAVVSNIPYKTAQRVIRNLDGSHFDGCRVRVREYRVRSWQNDARRGQLENSTREELQDRRMGDRRNCWVITEVKDSRQIVIEGLGDFARDYSR
jgi:hypothetical protein